MNFLKEIHLAKIQLPPSVKVFTDGAIRPERNISGLSAIIFDPDGNILHWRSWQAGKLTCNEAEYQAVILALENLLPQGSVEVDVYTDSQILVQQMGGMAAAKAPGLRQARDKLRGLIVRYKRVAFHHIPRQQNRLADALANEAAEGRTIQGWSNGHR